MVQTDFLIVPFKTKKQKSHLLVMCVLALVVFFCISVLPNIQQDHKAESDIKQNSHLLSDGQCEGLHPLLLGRASVVQR